MRHITTRRRHGGLNVAAAVMVMADRDWPVTVPIRVEIGNLFRSHMDMSRVMIVICFDQSDSGPVSCMSEIVLRPRHAMQVHGRQQGDAQADAEVAREIRQRLAPAAPVAFSAFVGNAIDFAGPSRTCSASGK